MLTIITQDAERSISRYLAAVENGGEILISRDKIPAAKLGHVGRPHKPPRPKVGEIPGEPFEFPASAFAPLTSAELKEWGWAIPKMGVRRAAARSPVAQAALRLNPTHRAKRHSQNAAPVKRGATRVGFSIHAEGRMSYGRRGPRSTATHHSHIF